MLGRSAKDRQGHVVCVGQDSFQKAGAKAPAPTAGPDAIVLTLGSPREGLVQREPPLMWREAQLARYVLLEPTRILQRWPCAFLARGACTERLLASAVARGAPMERMVVALGLLVAPFANRVLTAGRMVLQHARCASWGALRILQVLKPVDYVVRARSRTWTAAVHARIASPEGFRAERK